MSEFRFKPASWIPFQDQEVTRRLAAMTSDEIVKHPNPDLHIKILGNAGSIWIGDMYERIVASDRENKPFTFICGNPNPLAYLPVAEMINRNRISCRNVYPCTMDEWADDEGHIAPISWPAGFTYSFLKYFINQIDPELRPPEKIILYPTDKNIASYSDMIDERGDGGADVIYSGPGWAGHVAFIDPCPEFIPDYTPGGHYPLKNTSDPYFEQTAKIVTLHPLTIAQNSLHGVFGCSGDVSNVPPKAATIGPRDVLHARKRIEFHNLSTMGTFSSWQRMTSRLILHGPTSAYVPGSMFQLTGAYVYVDPSIAVPISCNELMGY
jgi:glucosamine-6-phosphate deaminase